jgi:hypothetical protein
MQPNDMALVREYATSQSEQAFAEVGRAAPEFRLFDRMAAHR